MPSRFRIRLALPVFCALTSAASAAPDGSCTMLGDLKDGPPLAVARVVGSPRTFFVKDASEAEGCPASTESCRARGFLVPGDRVVVEPSRNGFTCAAYLSPKGQERAGWLPDADLVREEAGPVTPADWYGTWVQDEATITIKPKGDQATVKGDATYGAHDPDRVRRGAVNVGTIDAVVTLRGADVAFAQGMGGTLPVDKGDPSDCKVWLRRLGPYLLADDNLQCGGMNVSFRGTYVRKG